MCFVLFNGFQDSLNGILLSFIAFKVISFGRHFDLFPPRWGLD